jgi:hypothetical protein
LCIFISGAYVTFTASFLLIEDYITQRGNKHLSAANPDEGQGFLKAASHAYSINYYCESLGHLAILPAYFHKHVVSKNDVKKPDLRST